MNAQAVYELAVQAHAALDRRVVVETPLLVRTPLDGLSGAQCGLKAEVLQRGGSFKFRGAWNAIRGLDARQKSRGVVAFSSGNHAVAVATAAALHGVQAVVIMPADAPAPKVDAARAAGAEVVFYERETGDREALGAAYVARGRTLIPPYDHHGVMAGAATGAIEAARQWSREFPQPPQAVVVPCSGGGMAAAWGVVMRTSFPDIEIFLAEPAGFDDAGRSLAGGARVANTSRSGSICDALLAQCLGELTFPLLREVGAKGLVVSDDDVLAAMRWSACALKQVVEPGGAAALAAVLSRRPGLRGKRCLIALSGGNVDPALLARAVTHEPVPAHA